MATDASRDGSRSAWDRFWFSKADPTTLGFMRIMAGLLTLYIHLAYTFDLQNFMGANGWYELKIIQDLRRDTPYLGAPMRWGDDRTPEIEFAYRPPDSTNPALREDVLTFLADLPDDRETRKRKLRLIESLPPTVIETSQVLLFVQRLAADPDETARALAALINPPEKPDDRDLRVPPYLAALPDDSRKQFRDAILDFLTVLPENGSARENVLAYLRDSTNDEGNRTRFLRYATERLPTDRAERAKVIDYLRLWSMDPGDAIARGQPIWSIWYHVSDPTAMAVVHGLILFIIALFTIGLFSRVMAVLTWLAAVSYIQRSPAVLFGMDTMMNIALFYLMLAPCGAALSVDRLIARYRMARANLKAQARGEAAPFDLSRPLASVSANFVMRLFQIHFCFIYMASGLSKLKGPAWWNHTALWRTLANPEFSPMNLTAYNWFLTFISDYRPIWEILMTAGVGFTLVLEISLPFLIWTRLRPLMVLGGVLLHAGIGASMGLSVFSMFMMVLLLAYIPPAVIRRKLESAAEGLPRMQLAVNTRSTGQARAAALVKAVDVCDQVEVVDAARSKPTGDVEPMRLTIGGERPIGEPFDRLVRSLRLLRPLKPLLWVPGIASLGRAWFRNGTAAK